MNILFIHQNFPGQFKFLAPALAKLGHQVIALTMQKVKATTWQGVKLIPYSADRGSTPNIHPWIVDFETKTIRGQACYKACLQLKLDGFSPDIIVAHPGWGESLFLKEIWPHSKLGIYCEFYYQTVDADVGFDPEFKDPDPSGVCRIQLKNLNNLMHFQIADAGISPTQWQASTFPEPFRSKISIVHDGIDTEAVRPDPKASITIKAANGDKLVLTRSDEVITFVSRNLEPYRGYHTLMRSLPEILAQRPHAKVLIVGNDDVSYGAKPDPQKYSPSNWKDIFIQEVRPKISEPNWSRVYFLGHVPYQFFIPLLQVSTVHIYLTYPFVLSWSLLEAMSAGCSIVASNTAPLLEAIKHNETGKMIDFFNPQELAKEVIKLAGNASERNRLGQNARNFAVQNYDLQTICLPKQLKWVVNLMEKKDQLAL
jgi:glycosyltransferase involved in cell wall biosynthesis